MTRGMRDNKIRPDIHDDVLRRHATGPEYWHFAIPDCDAVPKIRLVNIYNPNHFRISDMDRRAMDPWHLSCHHHCLSHLIIGKRPHADHHVSFKYPGRRTGDVRLVHWNFAVFLNMSHRKPRIQKGRFK